MLCSGRWGVLDVYFCSAVRHGRGYGEVDGWLEEMGGRHVRSFFIFIFCFSPPFPKSEFQGNAG